MKPGKIFAGAGILILLFTGTAGAQESAAKEELEKGKIGKYERKSISYFKTYYQVPMDQAHRNVTEQGIRTAVELGRFDYNEVPLEVNNISELAGLIASYVDQIKLDRARATAKEDYRFKEKMVTGADLERVVNSAFIYTPTVTEYRQERISKTVHDKMTGKTATKHFWKTTVGAEVDFYHVVPQYVDGQIDSVKLSVLKEISATAESEKEITIITPEDKARWGSFESAVNNPILGLSRKLQVEIRKLSEFQLTAQVQSSSWNSIEFEFGKQSDVELDAGYKVYEEVLGKGQSYIGYVKVRRVGDEQGQPPSRSRAQKIIQKEAIESGTQLKEYPQLLVNVFLRGGIFSFTVNEDDSSLAFGPVLGAEYDVARFTGISELWVRGVGHFGFYSAENDDTFWFAGGEAGIVKKFYLRRLGLGIGVQGGYSRMAWSRSLATDTLYQNQYGLTGFGDLELIITPKISLTAEAGYRLFTYSDVWMVEGVEFNGPEANTQGLLVNFGLMGMF